MVTEQESWDTSRGRDPQSCRVLRYASPYTRTCIFDLRLHFELRSLHRHDVWNQLPDLSQLRLQNSFPLMYYGMYGENLSLVS